MRRARLLSYVVVTLLAAAFVGAGALGSSKLREKIKSSRAFRRINSTAFRRLDALVYNLKHPPIAPAGLGDGLPPDSIVLGDPMGLAVSDSGVVYLTDRGGLGLGRVVWEIRGQTARIIAGTGRRGVADTGIPARQSDLGSPQGLALDGVGRLLIADSYNHVILRVEPDGQLTRVAGVGTPGDQGDGGPAAEAELNQPYDVRVDDVGNIYIADYGNHRIRQVTADGVIHTVAGTGEPGYTGDGGPATRARLHGPYGVYYHSRHGLLIADSHNNAVRRVDAKGNIETLAGSGARGNSGDEGPAKLATFDSPQSFVVDRQGRIFVDDEHNHEIRMIDSAGVVHRIIGSGASGFSSDGSTGLAASLNDPENMAILPDGSLLLTEAGNGRLVMLQPDGRLLTVAGRRS